MSTNTTDWNQLNPFAMWRDLVVKSESQWSETMTKMLRDQNVAGALTKQSNEGRMLQRQYAEFAQASLAAMNFPSRSDFESLDERLGRMEDGLAAVAAEVATLRRALAVTQPSLATAPSRTRKVKIVKK